ncbi:peptidase [Algimonas arctica]|uniref:Peptidase n=1 Tax=Algimonas arctica TaxID=1479486 RepID=A0A8J3G3L4_9PROT|nr:ATP-binding cassette domain-containing protein [Algimonas arctica]GHB05873.1 peptidase [Algimonas arctica]
MRDTPSLSLMGWLRSLASAISAYIAPILGFTILANLLLLVSPFYMLQVYDRILTSGSIDTLIWLTVISVFLLGIYAAAEVGRRRLATLASVELDTIISDNMFTHFCDDPQEAIEIPSRLRYTARVKGFLSNQAILPFFDLPFAPLFIAILFVIHPLIGTIGLVGAVLMVVIAVTAEGATRATFLEVNQKDSQAFELALGLSRQRSAIVSMGLTEGALSRWKSIREEAHGIALNGGRAEVSFASSAKSVRQMLQILVLGAGGALAVQQQVSPGAIVAGSIILGRALAPIDQIVGGWKNITSIREAWDELGERVLRVNDGRADMPLSRPDPILLLDRLAIAPPASEEALIRPFRLQLQGGTLVTLLGPIGSGKTSLLQTVVGAWQPFSGKVVLGGRDVHAWASDDRGPYVGYVPQGVELLPGTIAQNIARMGKAEPEAVILAAQEAGAHAMILSLKNGYDTLIGPSATVPLSAGQTQLIGYARALFGEPVLLILDEPTANLDRDSAKHVIASLKEKAERGAIVFVATHDRAVIEQSETVLAIREGGVISADANRYLASLDSSARKDPQQISTGVGKTA